MDEIEQRLLSHNNAFESLLDLIPSNLYYGKENSSNQWKRKKLSEKERKKARNEKLDPETCIATALDQAKRLKRQVTNDAQCFDNGSNQRSDDLIKEEKPETKPNIVDLHEKLKKRIAELREKRKTNTKKTFETRESILNKKRKQQISKDQVAQQSADSDSLNFGRIKVDNEVYDSQNHFKAPKKAKKTDVYGLLKSFEVKNQRISEYDEEKQNAIKVSDSWHNTLLKSQGEKVFDNKSLLKILKSKQQKKKKSKFEWDQRKESLNKRKDLQQRKRDENLANKQTRAKPKKKRAGF